VLKRKKTEEKSTKSSNHNFNCASLSTKNYEHTYYLAMHRVCQSPMQYS